jgi:hypothetical protein
VPSPPKFSEVGGEGGNGCVDLNDSPDLVQRQREKNHRLTLSFNGSISILVLISSR